MTAIDLRPSPMELGLYRERYEALAKDLRADGIDVVNHIPEERRGAGSDALTAGGIALAVHITARLTNPFIDHLVERIKEWLGQNGRQRTVEIIDGASGRVLTRVELSEEDPRCSS